jgi:hypothetical protein
MSFGRNLRTKLIHKIDPRSDFLDEECIAASGDLDADQELKITFK